jgi:hypothetical protein
VPAKFHGIIYHRYLCILVCAARPLINTFYTRHFQPNQTNNNDNTMDPRYRWRYVIRKKKRSRGVRPSATQCDRYPSRASPPSHSRRLLHKIKHKKSRAKDSSHFGLSPALSCQTIQGNPEDSVDFLLLLEIELLLPN